MLSFIKTFLLSLALVTLWIVAADAQSYLIGDIDGDHSVGFKDLQVLSEQWLTGPGNSADFNNDDNVDMADFGILADNWLKTGPIVVINEIHYNPDLKYELVEFVELYNNGTEDVDISGWHFCNGISYEFPQGTILPAGGYIVVAEDPTPAHNPITISAKYGVSTDLVYGPFQGNLNNDGELIELCDDNGQEVDQVDYQLGFPWPTVGDAVPDVPPGGTGHSIQLINPDLDNDLSGSWRSSYPTPAAKNAAVYADNIPPHIRQVKHSPKQPKSGKVVTITAKVTDPDGVAEVRLSYQLVDPGNYIPLGFPNYKKNPDYETGWKDLTMHDDGLNGDAFAGDNIYTVEMPAGLQTHRRLIRYRITVEDTGARRIRVPYTDDPQPNFVYFVYDGVSAWSGAIKPGDPGPEGEVVEYSAEVLTSLPVYHLISRNSDVENCQWNSSYDDGRYRFYGTLIYDGEVYDHIRYRIRGQVATFRWGKNKWKFNFNRGHYFQTQDDYGQKRRVKWNKMNVSAGACPWWAEPPHPSSHWDVGTGGMFLNECMTFRFYNMAGVPACKSQYFHFRVIDDAREAGPTQYDGDFWGLYFGFEHADGAFTNEHDLPDGNIYKMDGYPYDQGQTNQGPTDVTDGSDVIDFINTYKSYPSLSWWQNNVNLSCYYSFKAVGIAVNNSDPRPENNCLYYHNPVTGQWSIHPWDLDLTYEWSTHYTNWEDIDNCLVYSECNIANKNRARELLDLLFNADQAWQLVDEMALIISDPCGGPSFIDAERAMWEDHPRMSSRYDDLWYENNEFLSSKDWPGLIEYYKKFLTPTGFSDVTFGSYGVHDLVTKAADSDIPDTPNITYTGSAGYPLNDLTFQTSSFSDPQGAGTFDAMNWRIAEVTPASQFIPPENGDGTTILINDGQLWKYFKGTEEPSINSGQWRQIDFDDPDWLQGYMTIGYGEHFIITELSDMRGGYTTVYFRKEFDVINPDEIETLVLEAQFDDGINVWVNGQYVAQANVLSSELPFNSTANGTLENKEFVRFTLPDPVGYLVSGTNVIAVQLLNASLSNSSDCFLDIRLIGSTSATKPPSITPLNYQRTPGKYEIEAAWQSPEITDFNSTITIPASAVRQGRTYRVRCRMKDDTGRWSHWSAPVQFVAGEPLSIGVLENLRVTEVMYNPAAPPAGDSTDDEEFEFIELKNTGDEILDLTYVSFVDGITFDFNDSSVTSLAPGEFVLVVRNKVAFESRYGSGLSSIIAGEYSGRLANEGENVKLVDFWNGTIAEFEYNDGRGWPLPADGAGHSLVPLDSAILHQPKGSLNYGRNWRASTYIGGSPGADDPEPASTVVINEVMAHTNYSNPLYPEHNSNDWIELYNTSGSSVSLDNWYLSDDIDELKKWAIPSVAIAGHSYISFDEVTGFHNPITSGFGLDKAGEQVILSYLPGTSEARVVDFVEFKGQEEGVSLGRLPDGNEYWFTMTPSKSNANSHPILDIVIDEIMYHPVDANDEYIELYNPTTRQVVLENAQGCWRLDGGVDYTFPAGITIDAGSRLLIVGFDPLIERSRLDAFIAAYNCGSLTAGVAIVGPWQGNLSNKGERVALERPQAADQLGDIVSWVIFDEVIYGDVLPWPVAADGEGDSLQRIHTDPYHSGNDPANWQATEPTPGKSP